MASFEILPWVALRWGRPRDPMGGKKDRRGRDELFEAGLRDYDRLLVWDLEGRRGGDPQLEVYRRFEGKGLWVEGGARTLGTLVDILVAGADVAVVNGRQMRGLDVLTEATSLTGQLAFCVEEGPGLSSGRPDNPEAAVDLFREAQTAGIDRGLYVHHPVLPKVPPWVGELQGMEVYAGPVPVSASRPQTEGRVIANLYELV